eukprot:SAG31_NODE_2009_length_6673_cov_3.370094_4_plen_588_part_00
MSHQGFDSLGLGVADDYVEYWIYLPAPPAPTTPSAAWLHAQSTMLMDSLRQWTDRHIWHRDPFILAPLQLPSGGHEAMPHSCLYGRTYWGEDIEDEWFVVWLLLQLTKIHAGLVASVTDNDGQFLLIEAALDLPSWLKPETAENRVWLSAGAVHLLPMPNSAGSERRLSTVSVGLPNPVVATEAVEIVRARPDATVSSKISGPVLARLAEFDSAAAAPASPRLPRQLQLIHRARVFLPTALLGVLTVDPAAVAPAVEAFCARDPIDLKVCSKMTAFPPATRAYGLVSFSRCLYAQLAGQRFAAPKPFTSPAVAAHDEAGTALAIELGVKLACGFEMLYQSGLRNVRRQEKRANDTYNAPAAQSAKGGADAEELYMEELRHMGFFNDQEGVSQKQQKLYARSCWSLMLEESELNNAVGGATKLAFGADAGRSNSRSVRWAQRLEHDLQAAKLLDPDDLVDGPADSDSWLQVSEADVEALLKARQAAVSGGKDCESSGPSGTEDPSDGVKGDVGMSADSTQHKQPNQAEKREFQSLATRFEEFLQKTSGLEGVEIGDEDESDGHEGGGDTPAATGTDAEVRPQRTLPVH